MNSYIYYLASPYSHKDWKIKKQRAEAVTKAAVDLLHQGVYCFAPIAYNEPWEKFDLPGDWQFWEKFDKAFIDKMDGVIVLQLDGWEQSVGVAAEIQYAKSVNKPVYYITESQIETRELDELIKSGVVVV